MSPSPADGVHLFLTQTQYHVLLAVGYAEHLRRAGRESRLLPVDDFWNAGEFLDALAEWPGNPFAQIARLGRYERHSGREAKKGSVRRLVQAIDAALGAQPIGALYVFNDRNNFAQYALQEVARRHPAAARVAIEDGSSAYSTAVYRRYNPWRAFLQRRRFGRGWANLEVLGTHPLVQRFVGHYPQLFRPELTRVPGERYPTEILREMPLGDFARLLGRRLGIDPAPWQQVQLIMPMPADYVFRYNPDYPERMRKLLAELQQAGLRVGIKYHPRDQERDYVGASAFANVVELPRAVPFELMFLLFDARPRLVVGDISSATMLADKFNPHLRPVTFRHAPGFHDYGLTAQFEKLGIPTVDGAAALIALARTLDAL